MSDIAKTTVYITDMANFAAMNEVYKTYFPSEPPARATVKADLVNRASWSRSRRFAVIGQAKWLRVGHPLAGFA